MKPTKSILIIGFALLSLTSALAQTERANNDTTGTSQTTRLDTKYFNSIPYQVQKGKAPRPHGLL